jgi:phosphoglycolate phosphatase-like HAD superfamily hydrolase
MSDLVKGHIIFDHDGTLVQLVNGQFQLFAGMKEMLFDLKKQNFTLYIWTARPRSSVLSIINRLEIAAFFDGIYCSDDGPSKPHPFGLEILTDGISKNSILHIGDSMTDIDGAKAFGIEVIAACWNDPGLKKDWQKITPLVASDLVECKKLIRGKYV